jgi:hypothetical protein
MAIGHEVIFYNSGLLMVKYCNCIFCKQVFQKKWSDPDLKLDPDLENLIAYILYICANQFVAVFQKLIASAFFLFSGRK